MIEFCRDRGNCPQQEYIHIPERLSSHGIRVTQCSYYNDKRSIAKKKKEYGHSSTLVSSIFFATTHQMRSKRLRQMSE